MNPKSVLFVDDEQSVLDGLKRSMRLRLEGIEAFFLTSSKAALDFVIHKHPDVVVSDIRMPELNGLELVARIKEAVPGTKTIMLTGTGDLTSAVTAINDAAVFRFYTKPCEPDMLASGILEALQEKDRKKPGEVGLTSSIGTAALNHLRIAVIIVDKDCRIVFTNNTGASLFAEHDGLSWGQDDRPKANLPGETKRLHALLKAAVADDFEKLGDGVMALSRKHDRPFSLAISKLQGNAPSQHAIIFVSDPGCPSILSPEAIATLFNLSPAEARLTHALAMGEQLAEAAALSGVTVSTARTYLKQIFQKTETNRQSELIKLVLSASASR